MRVMDGRKTDAKPSRNEGGLPGSAIFDGCSVCGAHLRRIDWSSSPLGSPEGWPASLRMALRLILNAPQPMYIFWGADSLCFHNDAYIPLLGPERHPASLGQPGREVWAEIWPVIAPQIEMVMSGAGSTLNEDHLIPITRNGKREDVYWSYSYSPIDDPDAADGVGGVLVLSTDTTAKVLARNNRAREVEALRLMFEKAPSFMCLLDGPDHVFRHANEAYLSLVGRRDILGKTVREALPEVASQGFFEQLDEIYRTGQTFRGARTPILLDRHRQGTLEERFLEYVYQPVTNDDGAVTGIFVDGYDMTEAVLAERQLSAARAEAEARWLELEELYSAAPIGLAVFDRDFRFLKINDRLARINGLSSAEHVGKRVDEVLAPDVAWALEPVRRRVLAGEPVEDLEISGAHASRAGDGTWLVSYRPLRAADGTIHQILGAVLDITDRKRAERALTESEIRYRSALRVGRIGAWETNFETGVRFWSDEGMALFGIDLPGGRGTVGGPGDEWRKALHPDETTLPDTVYGAIRSSDTLQTRYRIVRPDGEVLSLLGHAEVVSRNAEGAVTKLVNVVADITELTRVEEALRLSEARFRAIQETSIDGFMMLQSVRDTSGAIADFRWIYVNDAAARIVGRPRESFIGRKLLETMPGNREEGLFDAYVEVVDTGEPMTRELSYRHEGLDIYIRAVCAKAGDGFAVTFADLSERRRAEERVRESEARLASALAAGQLGVYDFDIASGTIDWDDTLRRLWGVPSEEPVTWATFAAGVHPDDMAGIEAAIEQAFRPDGHGHFQAEYRVINRADGDIRWVIAHGDTSFVDGKPVRLVGTVRDITERKQSDAHRALLLEELNHRVKNTLATVKAIASQTLRGHDVPVAAREAFDGRLMALAGAHELLIRENWSSARLHDIVEKALAPHAIRGDGRIHVSGPNALLESKAGLALTLCLHELATNAAKYGALSNEAGRVSVAWTVEGGLLALRWEESGGPAVPPPTRRGFGSRLVERVLGADLQGEARIIYAETGVICEISARIS